MHEDDDGDDSESEQSSSNYEDESEMPLLKYARLLGSLPRHNDNDNVIDRVSFACIVIHYYL